MNAAARLLRRALRRARRRGWAVLSLLFCVAIVSIGVSSPASAAGLPFIDLCHASPPVATTPYSGLPGLVGERPNTVSPTLTTHDVWSNGGFAGLQSHTYDLGCAADPSSYARLANANSDNMLTNGIVGAGQDVTSLADSVDRRAWNPTWVVAFLGDFAARAVSVLRTQIWFPLVGLGLIAATAMLLYKNRRGDVAGAASGVAWAVLVIVIGTLVLTAPTIIATGSQNAGGEVIAGLNGGTDAADAQTDHIVEAVQYQGWLRRTFGTADSAVAQKYGIPLLAASRISWSEYDQVHNNPQALNALVQKKSDDYKQIAKEVKAEDPTAYTWLTGEQQRTGVSFLELLFAFFACVFHLMVDLLLVTATILLVALGLVWVAASPWLVTPAGRGMGHALLDNTARCVGYVLVAAIGSWLYGVYLQAALMPGMSAWWSVLLLFLGTIIFWTVIRPDRKMLSMISMGQVNGAGGVMRIVRNLALAYLGGRVAGAAVARTVEDAEEAREGSEDQSAPAAPVEGRIVDGPIIMQPTRPLAGSPVMEGEVISSDAPYISTTERGLPSGETVYQRDMPEPDAATPPPANSLGEVEVYHRPASAAHPDDALVPCPWCHGDGCPMCDGEGTVPRWVRDEVTR